MHQVVKQSELRNNNAEIMRRVAAGESFTVTVHGHPVADLVPRTASQGRKFVPAAEFDAAIGRLAPIDVELWKRDMREADDIFGDDQPADPFGDRHNI